MGLRNHIKLAILVLALCGPPRALAGDHWAFSPPVRGALPVVSDETWTRTAIDHFILARLDEAGIEPAEEADRITLLRRLYLDLTGLPPTIEQAEAFLADSSPSAYQQLVEQLLASPHYGEKWGRHWLDAARYADSNGYEKDLAREMWHYRDWVIRSFNNDLPYDQFIIEQIAGDLLPDATQDQKTATGFLRNSMINEEGAIDPEQFRMEAMFDRMDCVGKAVLGLTIQCAQCHDHKYDPLSQKEYFQMFAFLNAADDLTAPYYSDAELRQREEVLGEIDRLELELQGASPDWVKRMLAWEKGALEGQPEWTLVEPYEFGAPDGLAKLQLQPDRSLLAGGHPFGNGTWFVKARTQLTNITGVRLEALANTGLPMHGPGRSRNGLFGVREFRLSAAAVEGTTNLTKVVFASATADFEQPQSPAGTVEAEKDYAGPVRFAIDGNPKTTWTVDAGPGRRNTDRQAVFVVATNFGFAGGTELRFEIACREELASIRLAVTGATNAVAADPLPKNVREILPIPFEKRTRGQIATVFSYWRTTVPEFASVNERIDAAWGRYPEASGTTLTLNERKQPRTTTILKRGDWLKPGDPVQPGVPGFLHPLPGNENPGRLAFARWLADQRSPTTARVFVNRLWQSYFGTGLVSTPEDFGLQSERPSHPELLDWLACEFMTPLTSKGAKPWSIKHLHRLIVHSATYRQSSRIPPALYEKDPYNRLLARGARFRVEGEVIRDIALAASGLLQTNVGGPPVFSPAPAFLFQPPNSYSNFPWQDATGPDRYRRAVYTFRRRSTPYPMLQNFDTPNGDSACVRRVRSNTPLQALTTLNETVFLECAQALAREVLVHGGGGNNERLRYGFQRVLTRLPNERELSELDGLLRRQRQHIAEGWLNASELAMGTSTPKDLPPGTNPAQLAAYTAVCRVLLNLDEAITKE